MFGYEKLSSLIQDSYYFSPSSIISCFQVTRVNPIHEAFLEMLAMDVELTSRETLEMDLQPNPLDFSAELGRAYGAVEAPQVPNCTLIFSCKMTGYKKMGPPVCFCGMETQKQTNSLENWKARNYQPFFW